MREVGSFRQRSVFTIGCCIRQQRSGNDCRQNDCRQNHLRKNHKGSLGTYNVELLHSKVATTLRVVGTAQATRRVARTSAELRDIQLS